ncbi:hypothetical protein ABIF90_007249 [Bradyrhizobium japonicum]
MFELDDPSSNAPIDANLFDDEGDEAQMLIWSRPRTTASSVRPISRAGRIVVPSASCADCICLVLIGPEDDQAPARLTID